MRKIEMEALNGKEIRQNNGGFTEEKINVD
jgi:hypothetical protein